MRPSRSSGISSRGTRHQRMAHYTGLVARADKALYEAKRLGRDRVALDGGPTAPLSGDGATLFRGAVDPSPVTP